MMGTRGLSNKLALTQNQSSFHETVNLSLIDVLKLQIELYRPVLVFT
jgi:hypothetical protein